MLYVHSVNCFALFINRTLCRIDVNIMTCACKYGFIIKLVLAVKTCNIRNVKHVNIRNVKHVNVDFVDMILVVLGLGLFGWQPILPSELLFLLFHYLSHGGTDVVADTSDLGLEVAGAVQRCVSRSLSRRG